MSRDEIAIYNNVIVETEEDVYEETVTIKIGDVVGIIPDASILEDEYGPGRGPGVETLFKRHARHLVPWRRVVHIDRGEQDWEKQDDGPAAGRSETGEDARREPADDTQPSGGGESDSEVGADETDGGDEDDDPDNVFDEV